MSDPSPVLVCRQCGNPTDSYTEINAPRPRAGAVSICLCCRAIGLFTGDGLHTREPSADELAVIAADQGVQQAIALAALAHRAMQAGSN